MTQEEKLLLLKDLCSRLPYGVKAEVTNTQGYHHDNVAKKGEKTIDTLKGFDSSHKCFTIYHDNPLDWDWTCSEIDIEDIKPYLFPLSSMTEEQKKEYDKIIYRSIELHHREYSDIVEIDLFDNLQEFYHKNHLDYRDLISMGLANDATGLNIY